MLGHEVFGLDGQFLQIHKTALALALAQRRHGHVGNAHNAAPVTHCKAAAPVVLVAHHLIFAAIGVLGHVGIEVFVREAAVALLGVDAVDRLRTPRNEPQRGAGVRIAAPGVEHVFGVLRGIAHGKAVEFIGVDVAVTVEKGGGNLLAHGLGKGHALAHAKNLVAAAVEAQFFHVQLHDGLKDAAAFLDLAPLRLGRRRALIEPAPVYVGQAGADAGEVAVALVGFHPEHIVHDVVGFVHKLNDLPGLVATVELLHFSQGHHQTHGISHNTLVFFVLCLLSQ